MSDLKKLISGYGDFYHHYFVSDSALYQRLSQGQSPETLIFCCSDSRVDPTTITNAKPGDICVSRHIGALVPTYDSKRKECTVSSVLELAVHVFRVQNIVVLGHSQCAGVATLLQSKKELAYIHHWMEQASEVREKVLHSSSEDKATLCEKESTLWSLSNLLSYPWVKSAVDDKKVCLYAWYFSIKTGVLEQYNTEEKEFEAILPL